MKIVRYNNKLHLWFIEDLNHPTTPLALEWLTTDDTDEFYCLTSKALTL